MKITRKIAIVLILLFAISACRATEQEPALPAPTAMPETEPLQIPLPGSEPDPDSPAAIAHAFYGWYTGPSHLGHVLGSDHEDYLTPRLQQELATFNGNYDPILLAQEHLVTFTVEPWYLHLGEAGVIVSFPLGEGTHDLSLQLVPAGGDPPWQIDRIRRGNQATPDGVARHFYLAYLTAYHAEAGPLASGTYREMTALSPAFVEEIDALLAAGTSYDPIWMAEAPPQRFRLDDIDTAGEKATVVLLCWWAGDATPSPLTVSLARQGESWAITGVEAPFVVPAPEEAPPPEAVVEAFFGEYLAAGGFGAGAHQNSPYLHPVFVAALAEQERQWQAAEIPLDRYDPLIQGLAIGGDPPAPVVTAGATSIVADQAEVQARRDWDGPRALPLTVSLQRTPAGAWQIVDVSSEVRPLSTTTLALEGALWNREETPAGLVARIYTAALAYAGDPAGARQVGERLGLPVAAEAITFCAKESPLGISVDGYHVQPAPGGSGTIASALVHTTFAGHAFTVDLAQTEDGWAVTGVTCGDTPAGRAHAFYTWYLGRIGEPGNYRLHNPFLDGTYRQTSFLIPQFEAEVDTLRRAGEEDPFLRAGSAPVAFAVEPGPAAAQATVRLLYGNGAEQTLIVTAAEVDGQWLIAGTELAGAADLAPPAAEVTVDTGDWVTYTDAVYPFSFRIPAGWEVDAQDVRGMEPEDRFQRVLAVYTAAVAAARATGQETTASGWPAGLPMVSITVIEGDGAALERAFVPPVASYEVTYNGYPVLVQQETEEYISYRYVFRHPQEALWVVFADYLTEFPGREVFAAEVEGILPGILSTVTFAE